MILIFSNLFDISTNQVQDWLEYYREPFFRINSEDFLNIEIDNISNPKSIKVKDKIILIESVKCVWIRKWDKPKIKNFEWDDSNNVEAEVIRRNLIEDEFSAFSEYLFFCLKDIKGISDKYYFGNRKLIQLIEAEKHGLRTPYSKVVNIKNSIPKVGQFITKPIEKAPSELESRFFTTEISENFIKKIPNKFHPSLIQEKIEKLLEIRVFYLDNSFTSIAIFSQDDSQTNIDFRNYNHKTPNRYVPYNLDLDTSEKIHKLMQALNLKSGSIDLIKDINGELIFLEVNPNGQFGMISKNGNENIEKKISNYLCNLK